MARGMRHTTPDARRGISRRWFIAGAVLLADASAALAQPPGAGRHRLLRLNVEEPPVVAFHADRLYLDRDPAAEPYVPPTGLRSLDGMDEMELRRLVYVL